MSKKLARVVEVALYEALAKSAKSGTATVDDLLASVIPAVEGHTDKQVAELEARIANAQSLCNATGRYNAARQKHWNIRVFACDVLAALNGAKS